MTSSADPQPDETRGVTRQAGAPHPEAGAADLSLPPLTEAEITVRPTDYAAAAHCLGAAGIVLLRGAVGQGVIADALDATQRAFQRLPGIAAAAEGQVDHRLAQLGMIAPGLSSHFPELLGIARQIVEDGVGKPILERYFGGDTFHDPITLRFRSHRPSKTISYVPLHQDVAFTALDRSWINFWVPLMPCGRDAPGLQVYPLRRPALFPHEEGSAPGGYPMGYIAEQTLTRYPAPLRAVEPVFEPGDLLIFDGFCPHRTVEHPGMSQTRLSFEFRYSSDISKGPATDGPRRRLRTA